MDSDTHRKAGSRRKPAPLVSLFLHLLPETSQTRKKDKIKKKTSPRLVFHHAQARSRSAIEFSNHTDLPTCIARRTQRTLPTSYIPHHEHLPLPKSSTCALSRGSPLDCWKKERKKACTATVNAKEAREKNKTNHCLAPLSRLPRFFLPQFLPLVFAFLGSTKAHPSD